MNNSISVHNEGNLFDVTVGEYQSFATITFAEPDAGGDITFFVNSLDDVQTIINNLQKQLDKVKHREVKCENRD